MNLKVEYFSAFLTKALQPAEIYLPVSQNATADLLNLLQEPDSFSLLSIRGDTQYEVVKAKNVSGTLVIERGLGGTTPVTHHAGSCVIGVTPLMLEAMKEVFCNYNCCDGASS